MTTRTGPHAAASSLHRDPGPALADGGRGLPDQLRLGVVAHAAGDLATAAEHYLRAHEADAESQAVRNNMGLLRLQQGDLAGADEWLGPLEHEPGATVTSLTNLGNLRVAQGRVGDGVALLERAVLIDGDGAAWRSLGRVRMLSGDMSGAEVAFTEAVRRSGPRADVLEHLGACLLHRGAVDDAIAATAEAVDLDPEAGSAWRQLSAALLIRQDIGSALEAARRSAALRPDDVGSVQHLATVLVASGRAGEATIVLDQALESLSSAVLATDRAVLALAADNAPTAVELLESIEERTTRANLYLGLAHLSIGHRRKAKAALKVAADGVGPDAEKAASVLKNWPAPTGVSG